MAAHGVYDTAAAWTLVTNKSTIIQNLIITNSAGFFQNISLETINCVEVLATLKYWEEATKVLPYALVEIIAPNVDAANKLNAAASDLALIALLNGSFPLPHIFRGLTQAIFDRSQNALAAKVRGFPTSADEAFDITALSTANPIRTKDNALIVLRILNQLRHGSAPQTHALSMYVVLVVSLIKMGAATAGYISKISRGVKDELNIDIEYLDEDIIKCIWINLGGLIDENNFENILADWALWIPVEALRLRLIVQQAAGEGLTALSTIKAAVNTAVGFPWNEINAVLPDEGARVIAAFQAVGDNQFYGYKKDLGAVKSTNYKSYAWVAKEVMIRVFGATSLRSYRGWTKTPVRKLQLETIIENYIQASGTAAVGPGTPADITDANLRAAIIANAGVP